MRQESSGFYVVWVIFPIDITQTQKKRDARVNVSFEKLLFVNLAVKGIMPTKRYFVDKFTTSFLHRCGMGHIINDQ
jgi:hypothetical protein